MASKEELRLLQTALEKALSMPAEALEVSYRPMFGGIGVYVQEKYFCSLSSVGLALKLSTDAQTQLLQAEPLAKPLQYQPSDPPSKHYVLVPQHFIEDPDQLKPWVEQSMEYALSLPAKKKSRK